METELPQASISEEGQNNTGRRLAELIELLRLAERTRKSESERIEQQFMNSLDTAVKNFDRETRNIRDTATKTRETVRDYNQQLLNIIGLQPLMIEAPQNPELQGDPGNNFQLAHHRFQSQAKALSDLVDDYKLFLEKKRKQEIALGVAGVVTLFILSIVLFANRNSIMSSFSRAGQQFKLPNLSLESSWPYFLIAFGGVVIIGAGALLFLRGRQANKRKIGGLAMTGQASFCLYCGKPINPGNNTCGHCGRQN